MPPGQLSLGDLDQVAARVVEHRHRRTAHLDRLQREPGAEAAEPLEPASGPFGMRARLPAQ
jgi:hypothetical protein